MKSNIFILTFLSVFVCHWNILFGQIIPDTSENEYPISASQNAIQLYSKTIGGGALLYNGREYKVNHRLIGVEGNPFLNENIWNRGSVYYDNQVYDSIHMKFNIYRNILIIGFYDNKGTFINLQLVNEKIIRFNWPGHHFIKIKPDTINYKGLSSGFYDYLYDGKTKVLAKYTKFIRKNRQSIQYLESFYKKDLFYIINDKTVFEVANKKSVIKALANKEHEIKAYIKKYKIKFKNENFRGIQIAGITKYYDSINE